MKFKTWLKIYYLKVQRNQIKFLHIVHVFIAESASKHRHQRYNREKNDSHGHFLHFYQIPEGHHVDSNEHPTCGWRNS